MNLILLEAAELKDDNTVNIADRRSQHIVRVLGARKGDTLKAGIINGPVGNVQVLSINSNGDPVSVELLWISQGQIPELPPLDLILALPRPIMLKRVLTQTAALGVGKIFLINANRVEKSFFQANLLKQENYRPFLLNGLEQARDTLLPEVFIHKRFMPFVEDFLPGIVGQYQSCLVAHPDTDRTLLQVAGTRKPDERLLLAVGPEGGWVDFEIDRFVEQGLQPFSLGKRILKVDTVIIALLAQLDLLRSMHENSL